jgi:hypothetical protein
MAATNHAGARDAAASQPGPTGDPLPSWREGASKQAILNFVYRVTADGGADAVRPEERVAVFDNDGTLWCEKPMPIQLDFILRRLVVMADQDPALRTRQPWQAAYTRDYGGLGEVITSHYHGDDSELPVLAAGVLQAWQASGTAPPRSLVGRLAHPDPSLTLLLGHGITREAAVTPRKRREAVGGETQLRHRLPPSGGNGGVAASIVPPTIYLPAGPGAHNPNGIPSRSVRARVQWGGGRHTYVAKRGERPGGGGFNAAPDLGAYWRAMSTWMCSSGSSRWVWSSWPILSSTQLIWPVNTLSL